MRAFIKLGAAAAVLLAAAPFANAASMTVEYNSKLEPRFTISGEIKQGDDEQFKNLVKGFEFDQRHRRGARRARRRFRPGAQDRRAD